jgi:hypothetical protein
MGKLTHPTCATRQVQDGEQENELGMEINLINRSQVPIIQGYYIRMLICNFRQCVSPVGSSRL